MESESAFERRTQSSPPEECYICRDITEEPLVRPCNCKGTISGVHASCVERWVRHHRLAGGINVSHPRCSICHAEYLGREERPGLSALFRHVAREGCRHFLRTFALVLLLMAFQESTRGTKALFPAPVRFAVMLVFASVAFYKFAILSTSLPPHRAPPRSRRARRFFVSDPQQLAKHVAEAAAMIAMLSFWYAIGDLPLSMFLPFAGAAILLLSKLCAQAPSLACMKRLARVVVKCACLPVLLVWQCVAVLLQSPLIFLHPLDAGIHIFVVALAAVMCLVSPSWLLLALWFVHAFIAALICLDASVLRKLRWKQGSSWWNVAQLAGFVTYCANMRYTLSRGLLRSFISPWMMLLVSMLWLCAVLGMCVVVNWPSCLRHYRAWQHRHGNFVLAASPSRVFAGLRSAEACIVGVSSEELPV